MNVLLNANVHVFVIPPLYDVFSSCFAAGALARFEVSQIKTIYQAVVDEDWGTAEQLLIAVMNGKLSGSVCTSYHMAMRALANLSHEGTKRLRAIN